MHGVPVLLKDNIDTHDKMPTTAGSRVLRDSYPLRDSWVAKKLREAGAVRDRKVGVSTFYRLDEDRMPAPVRRGIDILTNVLIAAFAATVISWMAR